MHVTNASDYLLERTAPDDVAVVDGGRRFTYAELRAAAGVLAARLGALGLPAGSRIGLLGPNSAFWICGYLAAMKLGAVAVPLSDRLSAADVRRNAELSGCVAALVDRRVHRRFRGALPDDVAVVTDEALVPDAEWTWPDVPTDPDADAVLMFTSGTTSRPRAVRVTHRNILANTESIVAAVGLQADDRALVVLPFSYCFGASLLHTHLRVGGRVVLCNSFAFPETAVDLLVSEECTVLAGVPSSFQLLLRAATFAARPTPSLRMIQQAGGKLPPSLIHELLTAKPDAQLHVMYGQTEATARLSVLAPEVLPAKIGSIGRGIPGVELALLDDAGRPVEPGQVGEIYARGENVSPGYLGDPEGSAAKFTPLGLRTGDLAVKDEDGFLYVVDRRDDFIKSWGYRISSLEVEACALQLSGLVSAAAVGVADDEAGEAVTLVVTLRPGARVREEDVLAHCRTQLPKYMVPRYVVVLRGLPLTTSGKVDKRRLRELVTTACAPG